MYAMRPSTVSISQVSSLHGLRISHISEEVHLQQTVKCALTQSGALLALKLGDFVHSQSRAKLKCFKWADSSKQLLHYFGQTLKDGKSQQPRNCSILNSYILMLSSGDHELGVTCSPNARCDLQTKKKKTWQSNFQITTMSLQIDSPNVYAISPKHAAFSINQLVGIVDHIRALVVNEDMLVFALAWQQIRQPGQALQLSTKYYYVIRTRCRI